MSTDGANLSSENVLLPSAMLKGGKHYTLAVLWPGLSKAPVDPETALAELRFLNIYGLVHSSNKNSFWLVIEPEHQLPAGQLVLLGKSFGAEFAVWDYLPKGENEWSLDFREFINDVQGTARNVAAFISDYWIAIGALLMVALGVFVYLVLRKR